MNKNQWDFVYDEEVLDTNGRNFFGIISNGSGKFLFYHAFADEEGEPEVCHVYNSILMNDDSEECHYYWTSDNEELLINALNNLKADELHCGEGSPIRTLIFKV